MPLTEFELIARYFDRAPGRGDVVVGIGDDGAILAPPPNCEIVSVTDTLVANVHFPDDAAPEDLGHKSLAVNLSDIAAMGANPLWASLALTLPMPDEGWLAGFSAGFFSLAGLHDVSLIGGDVTRGPLTVTVHVIGSVPTGQHLSRHGARINDAIYVTGTLGDACLGLAVTEGWQAPGVSSEQRERLLLRLHRPEPRVALGRRLLTLASSAIDISDGFVADLQHILDNSGVGALIDVTKIPLSPAARACTPERDGLTAALSGGDDYELCFTAPAAQADRIADLATEDGCPITHVGSITERLGLIGCDASGCEAPLEANGYRHF